MAIGIEKSTGVIAPSHPKPRGRHQINNIAEPTGFDRGQNQLNVVKALFLARCQNVSNLVFWLPRLKHLVDTLELGF